MNKLVRSLIVPESCRELAPLPLPPLPGFATCSVRAPVSGSGGGDGTAVVGSDTDDAQAALYKVHAAVADACVAPGLNSAARSVEAVRFAAGLVEGGTNNAAFNRHGEVLRGPSRAWALSGCSLLRQLELAVDSPLTTDEDLALVLPVTQEPTLPLASLSLDGLTLAESIAVVSAQWCAYAPWSHPDAREAALGVFRALARRLPPRPTPDGAAAAASPAPGHMQTVTAAESEVAAAHADGLLAWCQRGMRGSDWGRDGGAFAVRYVAFWVVSRLPASCMTAPRIAAALPVAFRLCDHWEASIVWHGASALLRLLERCPLALLQPHTRLIEEVLLRAAGCRAPVVVLVTVEAQQTAAGVLRGPAPAWPQPLFDSDGAASLSALQFSGPYDTIVEECLRGASLAGTTDLQAAFVAAAGAALRGSEGGAPAGGWLLAARDAPSILRNATKYVADTSDARLCVASLFLLRALVRCAPHMFRMLPQGEFRMLPQQQGEGGQSSATTAPVGDGVVSSPPAVPGHPGAQPDVPGSPQQGGRGYGADCPCSGAEWQEFLTAAAAPASEDGSAAEGSVLADAGWLALHAPTARIGDPDLGAAAAYARREAVDVCVLAACQAMAQAEARMYMLPRLGPHGIPVFSSGDEAAHAAAVRMVSHHAQLLLLQLRLCNRGEVSSRGYVAACSGWVGREIRRA